MASGFLFDPNLGLLFTVVVFIIFVVMIKRILRILINAGVIAVISMIFPFFLNAAFGYQIPITVETFVFYITLGLGLYSIFLLAKLVYGILGFMEKGGKAIESPFKSWRNRKKNKIEKKVEKFVEKQEKEGKL